MSDKNLASAEAYYKAMSDKDLSGMAQNVHADVRFLGPLGEMVGKEVFIEAVGQFMSLYDKISLRAKFAAGDQVMVAYDLICPEPSGVFRVAALITFKDNLIYRIELFFDARPFDRSEDEDE